MIWKIAEPLESVYIVAKQDGLFIESNGFELTYLELKFRKPLAPCGSLLPELVDQLFELGYAEPADKAIRIDYDKFVAMHEDGINAFDELTPWAPFYLELATTGSLGAANFKYQIKYFLGNKQISIKRLGCFVKYVDHIFRLDQQTYLLEERIQQHNDLQTSSRESLIHFAEIKGLAQTVGAQIDQFIQQNKVLITPAIGIDLIEEPDGRISFAPYIDGVRREDLSRAFLCSEDVDNLQIDDAHGGRIRLVFSSEQQEILHRMAKVRKLGGQEKIKVLRNPQALFDGVAGAVDLEIGDFGPRVKGIGRFPFIVQPVIQRSNLGIFYDANFEPQPSTDNKPKSKLNVGLSFRYQDGTEERELFKSLDELIDFNQRVQSAFQKGEGHLQFGDKSLVVDEVFARDISNLVKKFTFTLPARDLHREDSDRMYLLIYENDDELEYREEWEIAIKGIDQEKIYLPNALRPDITLKKHQIEGLRWLQENYLLNSMGRKGGLLADDMGLGKTLQILSFIAWLIEQGELSYANSANPEAAPWKPVLIIMPVMLLENETWIQDMKKFFNNEGSIFTPRLTLYGKNLKNMRIAGSVGQEALAQKPLLDMDELRKHRVVMTNYETVVNYQFSFATMKSDWTLVVTDEAQAQKTPKTKISHALKSLYPKFRIACTGTPVETRLLDVWNIIDYIQPGKLLGSASDFTKKFEQPLSDNTDLLEITLKTLRDDLQFGKQTAYILRREKSQVLDGLPEKHEHKIPCLLSELQRELHIEYLMRAREGGEGNHPFALIQGLMNLYQHPYLIPSSHNFETNDFNETMTSCPKLSTMINILEEIRGKNEKALIFTRSRNMQQLLANTIFESLRQRIDIVNGAASRHETATSSNTRKDMLNRFREENNRNFIILSPDVAGIGLTLTEANHVIHYGRWWNPAKEAQATDRAYRIGQERDVHVYYLVAKDPRGEFKSFDEKLDALIDRRKKMAYDFLAPMPGEDELGEEIYSEVFKEPGQSGYPIKPMGSDDVKTLPWGRFEALIAVLEERRGNRVILTPQSGDMGMDVISIHEKQVRLIQCKHKRYGDELDIEVVQEVVNACDTYRARLFSNSGCNLKPVLATNGRVSSAMKRLCSQHEIEILSENGISESLSKFPCTIADIEIMEASRVASFKKVQEALDDIINLTHR